jgi:hypothetical protein
LANRSLNEPHALRLAADDHYREAILAAHSAAMAAGEIGYVDPEWRRFVLTAAYLSERGHCCEQGCRHCPYLD